MGRRRICVVTGTRAEYGILYWPLRAIQDDPELELQLIVTGMHLAPEFGSTHRVITADGFQIDARVDMLLAGDTPAATGKSIGLGVIGFAAALERLAPDILFIPGDRFEILAAAQAAVVARIPLAHLAGGDTTEGAFDESIRHALTKMSHIHFVTNEAAARRVRQMGENPAHIHNVGSPGIDYIKRLQLADREELTAALGLRFRGQNLLITFHPATLSGDSGAQFQELLAALDQLGPEVGLIFTRPNADSDGRLLIEILDRYAESRANVTVFTSLGQRNYLSMVAQVDAVVGNSSSGLYEVPSFGKPTVNIGDRQQGRLQSTSVINVSPVCNAIHKALLTALQLDCSGALNPYGDGESSARIIRVLKDIPDPGALLKKHFFELPSLHAGADLHHSAVNEPPAVKYHAARS